MKYIEPKIEIIKFSVENIVTLSVATASQEVMEAFGESGYTASTAVNVKEVLEMN